MPELKSIPHPLYPDINKCGLCCHWLRSHQSRVVMTAQGPVPIADAIKKGMNIEQGLTATLAACTLLPEWRDRPC